MKTIDSYRFDLKVNDELLGACTVDNEPVRRVYFEDEPVWGFPSLSYYIKNCGMLDSPFMVHDYTSDVKIRFTKDYCVFVLSKVTAPIQILVYDVAHRTWKSNSYISVPASFSNRYAPDVMTRYDTNVIALVGGYVSTNDGFGYDTAGLSNPNPQYEEWVRQYNPESLVGDVKANVTNWSPTFDWETYLIVDLDTAATSTGTITLNYNSSGYPLARFSQLRNTYSSFYPRLAYTCPINDPYNGPNVLSYYIASGASVNNMGGDVAKIGFKAYTATYGSSQYDPCIRMWGMFVLQKDGRIIDETFGLGELATANEYRGWSYAGVNYSPVSGEYGSHTNPDGYKSSDYLYESISQRYAIAHYKDWYATPKTPQQSILSAYHFKLPSGSPSANTRYSEWKGCVLVRYEDEYLNSRLTLAHDTMSVELASQTGVFNTNPIWYRTDQPESIAATIFRRANFTDNLMYPKSQLFFSRIKEGTVAGNKYNGFIVHQYYKDGMHHWNDTNDVRSLALRCANDNDNSTGGTLHGVEGISLPYKLDLSVSIRQPGDSFMSCVGVNQCVSISDDGYIRGLYENEDVELEDPFLNTGFKWNLEYTTKSQVDWRSKYSLPIVTQGPIVDDFNQAFAVYDKDKDYCIVCIMAEEFGQRL